MKTKLTTMILLAMVLKLTWEPVTTYEDGTPIEAGKVIRYEVIRSDNQGFMNPVMVSDTESVTATDAGIEIRKTYWYAVRAYIVDGMVGEYSDGLRVPVFPPFKVKITKAELQK